MPENYKYKVENSDKEPADLNIENLQLGEIGIATTSGGSVKPGDAVIVTHDQIIYLNGSGGWDYKHGLSLPFRVRRLLPTERLVITRS